MSLCSEVQVELSLNMSWWVVVSLYSAAQVEQVRTRYNEGHVEQVLTCAWGGGPCMVRSNALHCPRTYIHTRLKTLPSAGGKILLQLLLKKRNEDYVQCFTGSVWLLKLLNRRMTEIYTLPQLHILHLD